MVYGRSSHLRLDVGVFSQECNELVEGKTWGKERLVRGGSGFFEAFGVRCYFFMKGEPIMLKPLSWFRRDESQPRKSFNEAELMNPGRIHESPRPASARGGKAGRNHLVGRTALSCRSQLGGINELPVRARPDWLMNASGEERD